MTLTRSDITSQHEFCNGKYVLRLQHACPSCDLTDDEWAKITGYNRAVEAAALVMAEMEFEITGLRARLAALEEPRP